MNLDDKNKAEEGKEKSPILDDKICNENNSNNELDNTTEECYSSTMDTKDSKINETESLSNTYSDYFIYNLDCNKKKS